MKRFPAILAVVAAVVTGVLADDLNPPAWRGAAGASLRTWTFADDATMPGPTTTTVAGDTAVASIEPDALFATGWYDTDAAYGAQQGLWDLGLGLMQFWLPLEAGDGVPVELRVQLTYLEGLSSVPEVTVAGGDVAFVGGELVEDLPPFDAWRTVYLDFLVASPVSPLLVTLTAPGSGAIVDFVAIDAVVVPEPASAALLAAVAALGVLAWRRLVR